MPPTTAGGSDHRRERSVSSSRDDLTSQSSHSSPYSSRVGGRGSDHDDLVYHLEEGANRSSSGGGREGETTRLNTSQLSSTSSHGMDLRASYGSVGPSSDLHGSVKKGGGRPMDCSDGRPRVVSQALVKSSSSGGHGGHSCSVNDRHKGDILDSAPTGTGGAWGDGASRDKSHANVELLTKVFPQMKRTILELILNDCSQDVVKSIEQVLRSHGRELSSSGGTSGPGGLRDLGGPLHALHSAYPNSVNSHRFLHSSSSPSSSSVGVHPYLPYGSSAKSAFSLMSGLPALPGMSGGESAAMRHAYGSAGSRGLQSLAIPYHPAGAVAFLPNFGGLRYSAMVAAMVASAGSSAGKGIPGGFPYGMLQSPYKSGPNDK